MCVVPIRPFRCLLPPKVCQHVHENGLSWFFKGSLFDQFARLHLQEVSRGRLNGPQLAGYMAAKLARFPINPSVI